MHDRTVWVRVGIEPTINILQGVYEMRWRNWLAVLIGAWFILSPWIFGFSGHPGAVWTSIIFGSIQVLVSIWAGVLSESSANWSNWQNWISLLMGVWFVIQPWASAISGYVGNTWMSIILGLLTILLNLWTMGAGTGSSHSGRGTRTAWQEIFSTDLLGGPNFRPPIFLHCIWRRYGKMLIGWM